MRYIHSKEISIISFFILTFLVFFIPVQESIGKLDIILTLSTFLFAILVGFDLSRLNSRLSNVRENIAEEDARLLSFYLKAKIYGKEFSEKIKEILNDYYLVALDFGIWKVDNNYYKPTSNIFLNLYDAMCNAKEYRSEGAYESMLDDLSYAETARNKASVYMYAKDSNLKIYFIYILAIIILFALFINVRGEAFHTKIITILIGSSLVLILSIMRDLNNLMIQERGLVAESRQEVLESIGESRYYNKNNIERGITTIPDFVKTYRLGVHTPGEKREIKIVNK